MSGLKPQPGLLDIAPYEAGRSGAGEDRSVIKLSSNESPFGPADSVKAAYHAAVDDLHRYPDGSARKLRHAIAARHGLDPDCIICGDGSDELLQLICRAYASAGDEVIFSRNGFLVYEIATRSVGAAPVKVPERDYRLSIDDLLDAVTAKTRIVFIANPANPTGNYFTAADLARLHAGLPGDVALVIDAAYAEFVTRDDFSAGLSLAKTADNVFVTRTFSKLYGLASLRLGWGTGAAEIIDILNRLRGPFNVSGPAQAAGVAALEDTAHAEFVRDHVAHWRAWLKEELSALGLFVAPSAANFLLIEFPGTEGRSAAAADAWLSERGILLRRMDGYGLPACLRMTVGLESENRAAIEALRAFFDQFPARNEGAKA